MPQLTSSHLNSPYLTSPHLASRHLDLISPYLTLPHLTSPHLTLPQPTSPHLSPHLTSYYLTFLRHNTFKTRHIIFKNCTTNNFSTFFCQPNINQILSWNCKQNNFNTQNLNPLIKTIDKIKWSKIFVIFLNVSCPWARSERSSNYLPGIFQKLILAQSETTIPPLGLDKRKSQTIDRLSKTDPKREKSPPKKIIPNLDQLGPGRILLYKLV